MEKEKEILNNGVWVFILHLALFLFLGSVCIIAIMDGAREFGLALLLLLLAYLAMEERFWPCRVKTLGEDFTVFLLLVASWQASIILGWLLERGRLFPEAVLVGLCLLFLFFASWRLGRRLEEQRREAARLGLIEEMAPLALL